MSGMEFLEESWFLRFLDVAKNVRTLFFMVLRSLLAKLRTPKILAFTAYFRKPKRTFTHVTGRINHIKSEAVVHIILVKSMREGKQIQSYWKYWDLIIV